MGLLDAIFDPVGSSFDRGTPSGEDAPSHTFERRGVQPAVLDELGECAMHVPSFSRHAPRYFFPLRG
jgi:hypothetical protein